MFDGQSRYQHIETATYRDEEGREIAYVRRRFLPRGEALPMLVEIAITEGDRLDLITARTLGEPEQFWRVCDANNAMCPDTLTHDVGSHVRVPIPRFEDM